MVNVVFKLSGRLIITQNPMSFEAAAEEIKRLYKIDNCSELSFKVNLPEIGLAEMAESCWIDLAYGSLIEVSCNRKMSSIQKAVELSEQVKIITGFDEPKRLDPEVEWFENPSVLSSQNSGVSVKPLSICMPEKLQEKVDDSSSSFIGRDRLPSLSTSGSSISATTVSELDFDDWEESSDGKSAGLEPTVHPQTIKLLLVYAKDQAIPENAPQSIDLKLQQPFQVLLGILARILLVPAELIDLWLLRGSELTKISPILSPAGLQIQDNESIRVRLRSPRPKLSAPVSVSDDEQNSAPQWTPSFTCDKRYLKTLGAPVNAKRGLSLPKSPSPFKSTQKIDLCQT